MFLWGKSVQNNDTKCVEQFSNVKKSVVTHDGKLVSSPKKWCSYIEFCTREDCEDNIAQFLYAIPAYNACVENWFYSYKNSEPNIETGELSISVK